MLLFIAFLKPDVASEYGSLQFVLTIRRFIAASRNFDRAEGFTESRYCILVIPVMAYRPLKKCTCTFVADVGIFNSVTVYFACNYYV